MKKMGERKNRCFPKKTHTRQMNTREHVHRHSPLEAHKLKPLQQYQGDHKSKLTFGALGGEEGNHPCGKGGQSAVELTVHTLTKQPSHLSPRELPKQRPQFTWKTVWTFTATLPLILSLSTAETQPCGWLSSVLRQLQAARWKATDGTTPLTPHLEKAKSQRGRQRVRQGETITQRHTREHSGGRWNSCS